jgi:hypothetical protein
VALARAGIAQLKATAGGGCATQACLRIEHRDEWTGKRRDIHSEHLMLVSSRIRSWR